jgi:alkylhydroperoxidase family enzyme
VPWIPWIDIEDESSSEPEVQELFKKTRNTLTQKVSDVVKLTSLTPEVAALIYRLNQAILDNAAGLTVREREVAALVVSAYNGCVH